MRIECKFQKSHKKLHVSSNSLLLWYSILSQMVLFLKATYRFLKISMKRTEKYFQNRTRYFWRDNYIQMRIDHRSRSMYRRFFYQNQYILESDWFLERTHFWHGTYLIIEHRWMVYCPRERKEYFFEENTMLVANSPPNLYFLVPRKLWGAPCFLKANICVSFFPKGWWKGL